MNANDLVQVSQFEQRLIAKTEHFDTFLEMYDREHPMVYRDRIAREAYPLFTGLSQKSNIWHPGLGPQAGISDWIQIQPSSVASGENAGFNACIINDPQTYTFSVESKEYTGRKTEWKSPTICVEDHMWTEEAARQVGYIYGMGIMITSRAWEVYSREMYIRFAAENSKLYVMTEGDMLNDNPGFTYDPFTTYTRTTESGATEKFTVLSLALNVKVSTLNPSYLELMHSQLEAECPQAALSTTNGLRTFGFMCHLSDLHKAIRGDAALRQDLRDAEPQMLFANYTQTFKALWGWGFIHDIEQMRFKYWKIDPNDPTRALFRRVLPRREGRAITIGRMPEANPEYQTADLAVAPAFLKDVYKIRIPPTVASLSGKTTFGPAPGFNGEWMWLNYASDANPLRTIGYHYMRMAAFPAPLRNSTYACAFLYRRCPQTWPTVCEIGTATQAASGAVALADDAVAGDVDATNKTVTVKLASLLPNGATINSPVVVKSSTTFGGDANGQQGFIVSDANAPTYIIGFTDALWAEDSAAVGDYTNWTTSATVQLGTL